MSKDKNTHNNIIEFDAITHGNSNHFRDVCTCGKKAEYKIDTHHMTVHCTVCGNRVEPFKALVNLADKGSNYHEQLKLMRKEALSLKQYKPHLVTIKKLEKKLHSSIKGDEKLGTKSYPCCPNCEAPFELDEIVNNWQAGIFIQKQLNDRQRKNSDKQK